MGKTPKAVAARFENLTSLYGTLVEQTSLLKTFVEATTAIHDEEKLAERLAGEGMELMEAVRQASDELELLVDDSLWSLPKYRELLYIL